MRNTIARLVGVLIPLLLVATACGGDNATTVTGAGDLSTADDSGDASTSDDSSAPDEALEDKAAEDGMEEMHDDDHADSDHNHSEGIEVAGDSARPEVGIAISADPKSGQNLQVSLTNFEVTPENASTEHVEGQGHLHLYVDGERVLRFYNPWLHLNLDPGDHTVEVEVSANNHSPYTIDGEPIRAAATISVPEPAESGHSHEESIEVSTTDAPQVSVEIFEDPKSGWNVRADVSNFVIAPDQASLDPVDGHGHLHLYVDRVKITRLYGPWWHLDALTEGDHEIAVEVTGNNHEPYTVSGEPVIGTASISVPADKASPETPSEVAEDQEEDSAGSAELVVEISYSNGAVDVEDDRIEVDRGSVVSLVVQSDVAEHVHVHGYDLFVDIPAGETVTLQFTADVPGLFEIEFEDSFAFITELQVS